METVILHASDQCLGLVKVIYTTQSRKAGKNKLLQVMYILIKKVFVCCCLPVIMWFLFGEVSSSSGCLEWAMLFYCGTP